MKVEFWKNGVFSIYVLFIMTIICIADFVASIILTIIFPFIWVCIPFSCFMLYLCFHIIFFQKSTLTKVVVSNNRIESKRFGKLISIINWCDIKEIEQKYMNRISYLIFKSNKEVIDFVPSKKIYRAITILCPYPNVIAKINSIDAFKWLHKNKKENK